VARGPRFGGALPDVTCARIQENVTVPFFRAGRFGEGHVETLRAVQRALEKPGIKYDELFSAEGSNRLARLLAGPIPVRGAEAPSVLEARQRLSNAQAAFNLEVRARRAGGEK
jgi:hypothetical protein